MKIKYSRVKGAHYKNRLFFWHFFEQIEKDLSYERWINKYRLFLNTLEAGYITYEEDFSTFRSFCKILYLQDHKDEYRFDEILNAAIEIEKEQLIKILVNALQKTKQPLKDNSSDKIIKPATGPGPGDFKPSKPKPRARPSVKPSKKTVFEEQNKVRYFQPVLEDVPNESMDDGFKKPAFRIEKYLHTDEYYPVTLRQMIKGWQYLRRKEKSGFESTLDIEATVHRIAKDGMFVQPVLRPGYANREDTLILIADTRGSMVPFHELSRRLVHTARTEGGHPKVPVFYFQNYPVGKLFKKSNLSEPVMIKEALVKANRNFTTAIIISDAGAARGNTDSKYIENRVLQTKKFLAYLKERTSYTIWLNPMPSHRWKDTAADQIRHEVSIMVPIMDYTAYNFQETLRLILKQRLGSDKD